MRGLPVEERPVWRGERNARVRSRMRPRHDVRQSDAGVRACEFVDGRRGPTVTPREILVGAHASRPVTGPPRRPVAPHPAVIDVGVGLVHRRPPVHVRGEFRDDSAHVALERFGRAVVGPLLASLREPHGIGEVPQHHHALHPALADAPHHLDVAANGGHVESTGLGFDARPLHRDAVDAQAQRRSQVEVERPPVPRVGRPPGLLGDVACLFPLPPVGVLVAALDLVGRGARAPQETGREGDVVHPWT